MSIIPRGARSCRIGTGVFSARVFKSNGDWYYDGPVSMAPPKVRKRPARGTHWRGPTTVQFVRVLIKRAREHGLSVRCEGSGLSGRRRR